jgi:hypothetical protein
MGFCILAHRSLTLDLADGYLMTAGHFRELHGLRGRAGLIVSFWYPKRGALCRGCDQI